jgi:flagellar biosynthesis regulator FlbT
MVIVSIVLRDIWKEVFVTCFKALLQHFLGTTEEHLEILQSGQQVSKLMFEHWTYQILSSDVIRLLTIFVKLLLCNHL